MERIRAATGADAAALAALAKLTFPLACPPHIPKRDMAAFIAKNLSRKRFSAYLGEVERKIFLAENAAELLGYTMLVFESSLTEPIVELSKFYVHPRAHGTGLAAKLMLKNVEHLQSLGVAKVWLGVNQSNLRAQRFYTKHGFSYAGVRSFRVGSGTENDYVFEREISSPTS